MSTHDGRLQIVEQIMRYAYNNTAPDEMRITMKVLVGWLLKNRG